MMYSVVARRSLVPTRRSLVRTRRSLAPTSLSFAHQRSGVQIARCLQIARCKSTTSPPSSSTTTGAPVTAQDLQSLQQELKALQTLIREQRSQAYHVESLTRSVSAQSAQLEQRLERIESHVAKISAVEQIVSGIQHFLQSNPAVRLVLENLKPVTPVVKRYKYAILGVLATAVVAWKYRARLLYQSASEEVADLARRTLEQESLRQSIQETLHTVANNPSTLATLNELIQQLITHESTLQELVNLVVYAVNTPQVQTALMDLLQLVFKDPYLQQLTGEFLLKGLDVKSVKEMLDAQTAELVRVTVSNDSVQQATAVAVQHTFWYSITPPILWRFLPKGNNPQTGGDDSGETNDKDQEKKKEPQSDQVSQ